MPEKIIVVAGPTATGKTRLSIELAHEFNGEIVSADSMQIYRGMDVGTAKADDLERTAVVHHMLDVAEPWESYSVARYVAEAAACCEDILSRGKVPIVAGGTGLYIDSLVSGRDFAPARDDGALRAQLEAECDRLGTAAMLESLRGFDPERAAKLSAGDRRRIIRAIEIYRLTGKTATEHDAESRALPNRFDAAAIVLSFRERAKLYERIDRRVDAMVADGLFGEVEALLAAGLSPESTSMQAIGYKEAARYMRGELTRDEAVELIKLNSRRYAKRQLTWFGRNKNAFWIYWEAEPDFNLGRRVSTEFLRSCGIS